MAIDQRGKRVWLRLIQAYGSRMAESYGDEMPRPWTDAVEALTDEQISYGLKAIIGQTPVHPPTLGQFVQCCINMPVAQNKSVATLQEQLCEYAMLKMRQKFEAAVQDKNVKKMAQYSRPWTYVYREWWDATRPKGMEKCAECKGVVIDFDDGSRIGFSVENMQADAEVYQRVMNSFRRGPNRHEGEYVNDVRERMPDLTQ